MLIRLVFKLLSVFTQILENERDQFSFIVPHLTQLLLNVSSEDKTKNQRRGEGNNFSFILVILLPAD